MKLIIQKNVKIKKEIVKEKLYGSICHIANLLKQT